MRHPFPARCRTQSGFTLIELMIVVAIIAILASVAYPAYIDSVRKGRRAEARVALTELMQQQERYMTQRNSYMCFGTSGCATSTTTAEQTFKVFSGDKKANASYSLTAGTCDTPNNQLRDCVRLTAIPANSDPEAGSLWMTSLGEKGCTGTKTTVCWR